MNITGPLAGILTIETSLLGAVTIAAELLGELSTNGGC